MSSKSILSVRKVYISLSPILIIFLIKGFCCVNPINPKKTQVKPLIFLLAEFLLYLVILTSDGELLRYSSFLSIVFCFLYSVFLQRARDSLITFGLASTVIADFFLVVCSPAQQLYGMVFFLGTQILYAVKLHFISMSKFFLFLRIFLILVGEAAAILVLKQNIDLLVIISVAYYSLLIVSILQSFVCLKNNRLFFIGLLLFLLCDTVIGLQVAAGTYLPIGEQSLLYKILFMDFPLAWFFYLPSQVLISLSGKK